MGECGVPYLLGDQDDVGHHVFGEIYQVDQQLLDGMDDYEGVTKQYYERREIKVTTPSGEHHLVWVYLLPTSDEYLRSLTPIAEYTLDLHDRLYSPIRHIQIKQQKYLGTILTNYTS